MYLPSCGHEKARSVVKVVLSGTCKSLEPSGPVAKPDLKVRALAPSVNSGPWHEGRARCANTSGQAVEANGPPARI
jgi:hypothetical protein